MHSRGWDGAQSLPCGGLRASSHQKEGDSGFHKEGHLTIAGFSMGGTGGGVVVVLCCQLLGGWWESLRLSRKNSEN